MAKLTDLTGATVTVPSGWTCSAGYGKFNIQATGRFHYGETYPFKALALGYQFNTLTANHYSIGDALDKYTDEWDNTNGFELWNISGEDATNSKLIKFFVDNNSTIEGGVWEEETPPTKIKSPVVVIKQKVKQVVIDNANMTIDIYTKEVPATLISFTIDGVSYQAEDGMTWKQWCESDYNTKGASISLGDGVMTVYWEGYSIPTYFYAVSKSDDSVVDEDDVIISNYGYSLKRVAHA